MRIRKLVQVVVICQAFVLLYSLAGLAGMAAGGLSPQAAHDFLQATPSAFVLDVRLPDELASGKLIQSHNVPLSELEAQIKELPADRPIVVYCAIGRRAKRAFDMIAQRRKDITQLYYIDGKPLFDM